MVDQVRPSAIQAGHAVQQLILCPERSKLWNWSECWINATSYSA